MDTNSNIWSKNKGGRRRPEFWRLMMRCCQIAACIDILFFGLFLFLDSPILAWVNVASVSLYIAAYYAFKLRKKRLAVILMWTEILPHVALGVILIGWNSGFHYFLLMLIPAVCLSTDRKPAFIVLSCLFLFYVGLDVLAWYIPPIQPIDPIALKLVHLFNLSVVFIMFSYLSLFYLSTVRAAQKDLRTMATTDPLTSLYNRRYMNYLAQREVERRGSSQQSIGILLIDIDHFKSINDEYGHSAGDDVLVCVAQILKKQVRNQDLVSRWGGEEFLIILPNTNTDDAYATGQRIREAFTEFDWETNVGQAIKPTISAGVAQLNESESMSTAIARADKALYVCKNNGRDCIEVYAA